LTGPGPGLGPGPGPGPGLGLGPGLGCPGPGPGLGPVFMFSLLQKNKGKSTDLLSVDLPLLFCYQRKDGGFYIRTFFSLS